MGLLFKPTGRPTEMVGQSIETPCLMGLPANVMGQAGPDWANNFEKMMG